MEKNKYHLRILDGTSNGYTKVVEAERFTTDSLGMYIFYNGTLIKAVALYPISRTIIEFIEYAN